MIEYYLLVHKKTMNVQGKYGDLEEIVKITKYINPHSDYFIQHIQIEVLDVSDVDKEYKKYKNKQNKGD